MGIVLIRKDPAEISKPRMLKGMEICDLVRYPVLIFEVTLGFLYLSCVCFCFFFPLVLCSSNNHKVEVMLRILQGGYSLALFETGDTSTSILISVVGFQAPINFRLSVFNTYSSTI